MKSVKFFRTIVYIDSGTQKGTKPPHTHTHTTISMAILHIYFGQLEVPTGVKAVI